MIDFYEHTLSFWPTLGPSAEATTVGFRFGAKGTHSSRTMMFDELFHLLGVTRSDYERADYATAIIEENCLAKPTAATRRQTNQRLGELYGLDPSIPLFRVLRRLWDVNSESSQLLALLISISRDPLLAATAPAILFLPVGSYYQREVMRQVLQSVAGNRMNDTTLDKVCRNAASTWTQSGHLEGRTFKKRRELHATPTAVAFAIYLAHAAGFRGAEIFSSAWFRVLDCDPQKARHLSLEAKRIGLIDLRMAGEVVELSVRRLDPTEMRI